MKKFSRCALILILVAVLGAVGGYFYADKTITPVYSSETVLYVVLDETSEVSLRSKDGGLNDDFELVIKGPEVISEAQRTAGTSEDIEKYLTVETPANSNSIKIICNNPDARTAKTYVDAVARAAVNNIGNTIPVKSVKIHSAGTVGSKAYKPGQYTYMAAISGLAAAACLVIEILVLLCMGAFKKKEDNSDDESEYERRYGNVVYLPAGENFSKSTRRDDDLSNEDDTEKENDNVKVEQISAKVKQSDIPQNVLENDVQAAVEELEDGESEDDELEDEEALVNEKFAAVEQSEEISSVLDKRQVSADYSMIEEELTDDILFEEPVFGKEMINEAAVSLEASQSVYGTAKETASESFYGSMENEHEESVYGSMSQEVFTKNESEAAEAKSELFTDISRETELPKSEPAAAMAAEEPEDLPVMDAALQAQKPTLSQQAYKDEDENALSTAKVSSKYLYRGDENYRKPVSEPIENKQHQDEHFVDIGDDDIVNVREKGKKKSRIIGIIRK